jgi:hypothetical protein
MRSTSWRPVTSDTSAPRLSDILNRGDAVAHLQSGEEAPICRFKVASGVVRRERVEPGV